MEVERSQRNMRKSRFEDRVCPECGRDDLAHFAMWPSGVIPVGIEGFIGCRDCFYWEHVLTVSEAEYIFDHEHWVVLRAGQGVFDDKAEQEMVASYSDPEADEYPRHPEGIIMSKGQHFFG